MPRKKNETKGQQTTIILPAQVYEQMKHRVAEIFLTEGKDHSLSSYVASLITRDWEATRNQGAIARKVDLNTDGLGGK
jgi:hypothetical protein